MATEFKLPELGENIESGDVVRVAVAPGEKVSEGQAVIELETDKAVIEVPSSISGVVKEINVKQGQKVKVGQVIFTVEAGDGAQAVAPKKETTPAPEEKKPATPAAAKEAGAPPKVAEGKGAAELEFRLPSLGENIEAGDVVRVAVNPGDSISEGQTIIELETDKAVIEVPSSVSGVAKEIRAKQGQKLKVGDVILTLQAGEPAVSPAPSAAAAPPRAAIARGEAPLPADETSSSAVARAMYEAARSAEGKTERQAFPPDAPRTAPVDDPFLRQMADHIPPQLLKDAGHEHRPPAAASPLVRKLAREIGVDLYHLKGTGPGGRILEADVKSYAKAIVTGAIPSEGGAQAAAGVIRVQPKLPDFSKWGAIEAVSMRAVRRKTAEHLSEAWNIIPHVTQHDKADVTELEELRKRFAPKAEMAGGKMTMTAIALKVVASALKTFPQFNASIDMANEQVIYKRYINVGVAVDTDRGLLVPVIKNVDKKNIIELATELTVIGKKARDKKLTPEEMEGGTFTITNLGGIGGTAFTPIVNHPEVAILGMSRSRIEPVWIDDKFEPRSMLPLSLSYDHRLIDGADAARFVRWVVEALEQPFLLSVQG